MAGMRVRAMTGQFIGVALSVLILVVLLECLGRWSFPSGCHKDSDSQALFDYASFYYCSQLLPSYLKAAALIIWLLLIISMLSTTADNFFVPLLEQLSENMGLSEEVAGVTLLALGNGMPDLMTAMSAISKANDFDLVMGDIFGAASFVLTVVLSAVLLCSSAAISVEPKSFLLISLSYIVFIALIFVVSYDRDISFVESISFFVFYAIYVGLVILMGRRLAAAGEMSVVRSNLASQIQASGVSQCVEDGEPMKAGLTMDGADEKQRFTASLAGISTSEVAGFGAWLQYVMEFPFSWARHISIPAAQWNARRRILAAMCPFFGALVTIIGFGGDWGSMMAKAGPMPAVAWAAIFGALGTACVLLFSKPAELPKWHSLLLVLGFVFTVAWFNILANECVALLETFGQIFQLSTSILGITVLAWGNCVGDLVADTALARHGKAKMAIAGVFGSLVFSDVIGLGCSLTAYTAQHGSLAASLSPENVTAAIFLLCSVAVTVGLFILNGFSCPRWYSGVLMVSYAGFMVLSVLMELHIV